jgi:AcrR family transcriptional regulator
MCVYTKFTSRQGLLRAVYDRAAGELLARLAEPAKQGVDALAEAYRAQAATSPGMYAFLFEQYPASLELSPELRADLIEKVCALIEAASGGGRDEAATRWATMHGLVTLSLCRPPARRATRASGG